MKRLIAVALLALLVTACGTTTEPDEAGAAAVDNQGSGDIFDMPYLMRDLDNGLRVIVVPTDYPDIVTIQIPVQTGSRNEIEAGKSGFAHFFEHMMFRGTEKYPADRYKDILKKAGADQNAYTTDDYTNYHITFTKDDLEKIIELEADRFQNLSYSEEVFRTEALAVNGEYLKNYSNPTSKMLERLRDLMFDEHTYEHTTMGFVEDIRAMPEQLEYSKTFFDRWYRPEKTVVILVGDVDPEKTFALVEKYWGDWERGDYEIDIPVEPPLEGPKYEHLQWDSPTQPWLMMGFRGPAYEPAEKDMPSLDLMSAIYFSESSELYQRVVIDEQLADQLFAYFPDRIDPGVLVIAARLTDVEHMLAIRDAINATLVEARTQLVSESKVADTKSRLRYGFAAQFGDSGTIGAVLAAFVHFFKTPETLNEVYRTYDTLTAADIRAAANDFFTDSSRVTLTLSDGAAVAGVDGKTSLDEQVTRADMAETPATPAPRPEPEPLPAVELPSGDAVPVSFVTRPSDTSPLVDVTFLVHAGAALDPDGKEGLAALTAAMLTEGGSEALTIEQINAAMYPIAADFEAQVDKEMTRLSGQVHKDNLDAWYELARGQLLYPAWSEKDFERVKTQLINAIRTDLVGNNDEELAKEVLYTSIYGEDHPYGSLTLGTVQSLEALTLADVQAFYRDYYTIANTTVGLSGGYPDDFPARVGDDLQKLPAGERAVVELPPVGLPAAHEAVVIEKETPGVAVSFGFPIDQRRGDDDWVALWLARSWLGEHRSTNSHLFQRIRETRGMNYGNYAYIEYFPRGMFQFHPSTNLARQQQIFQVWIRPLRNNNDAHFATRVAVYELDKLIREGMDESDFEATKAYLAKFVSLLTDGQSRQLGYAIDSEYYGTGEFADYVRTELAKLTLEDVNRVIRQNLDTDAMQFVFVTRDAADLRQRLIEDRASPMQYDADLPPAVLEEDAAIAVLPLEFEADRVRVVAGDKVF